MVTVTTGARMVPKPPGPTSDWLPAYTRRTSGVCTSSNTAKTAVDMEETIVTEDLRPMQAQASEMQQNKTDMSLLPDETRRLDDEETPETGDSPSDSEIARPNAVLSRDLASLNIKAPANKARTHDDTKASSNQF
ncbi:hypothetical protein LTR93_011564 [Exophiala xenobiotica]|nr:hypothetical protein LTR93_011564 [Exophiala xenobiotica]